MKKSPYPAFTLYVTPELRKLLDAVRDAKSNGDKKAAYEALGRYVANVNRDLDPWPGDMD